MAYWYIGMKLLHILNLPLYHCQSIDVVSMHDNSYLNMRL